MRRGDFSDLAGAYAEARPGYPAALVDRLVARAGVRPGDPVADLGAGTGIFTRMLAARGLAVLAVEPSAAMRAQAEPHPSVCWREGTFEATGLPEACVVWAVAAQAFHWADPPRALPEIRRILRAGGLFTALWNERQTERSPLVRWVRAAIERIVPEFPFSYQEADPAPILTSTGHFGDVEVHEEEHVVPMDRARFLRLWQSHNLLNSTAGPDRFARFLDELTRHLDEEGVATVEVPYLCRAWSARAR